MSDGVNGARVATMFLETPFEFQREERRGAVR